MGSKAVVIGSGAAGLTAAVVLGQRGFDVTIVERIKHAAPLLRGFYRNNYYCDVGLHYLGGFGPGGMMSRFFAGAGLPDLEVKTLDPDGFDRILWPEWDLDVRIPIGLEAFKDKLCSAFPRSKMAVRAWVEVARTKLATTPFLNPDVPPWETQIGEHDRKTLAGFLEEKGAERKLIDFLGSYGAGLFGVGAEKAVLMTHVMVIGSYLQSAHTVRGGGDAIADAFMLRLDELGVQFRGAKRALEISFDNGRATGVVAGGETIPADVVVFTPHPSLLPSMLGPGPLRAAYERRVEKLENTKGLFLTFVGHEKKKCIDGGKTNTYVFFDDEASSAMHQLAIMAGSPPQEGHQSSLCLIREMPDEVFDMNREQYRITKRQLAMDSLDMARKFSTAIADDAEIIDAASPLTFEKWTGTPMGSAYGATRPATGRRLHAHTPVENLVLAGQSVLYPGIMGAVASGLAACCHIIGGESVWELLRE